MGSKTALRAAAVLCALPAAFFTYYTLRLIYINVAVAGVAENRRPGMYIGFVAFPVAAICFGWLAAAFWSRARRN